MLKTWRLLSVFWSSLTRETEYARALLTTHLHFTVPRGMNCITSLEELGKIFN